MCSVCVKSERLVIALKICEMLRGIMPRSAHVGYSLVSVTLTMLVQHAANLIMVLNHELEP